MTDRDDPQDGDFDPEEIALLRDFFRDEAHDALEQVTARLLAYDGSVRPNADAFTELMRATHTIKGSAGTVGLREVAAYAHRIEDHFAALRSGSAAWNPAGLERLIESIDAVRGYLDLLDDPAAIEGAEQRVRAGLAALGGPGAAQWEREERARVVARDGDGDGDGHHDHEQSRDYSIDDTFDGTVTEELRDSTRSILARLSTPSVPGVAGAGSATAAGIGAAIGGGTAPTTSPGDGERPRERERAPRAVLRVEPDRIDALMDSVGELAFDRTRIERRVQILRTLARDLGRTRQRLRDDIAQVRSATHEHDREQLEVRLRAIETDLAHQVTELGQTAAALLDDSDALRQTASHVQDGLTRVRMSTARSLFQHLGRALRHIARGTGKRVELMSTGAETEFDKAVAAQITDPLVQLLRNAVAHGIESPGERVLRGKAAHGCIRIAARQEGGLVILDVADDGRGIDPQTLRRRFVESGRWSQARAAAATDDDVLHAIFDPGMSSRDEADELSGRGVGLDAVRETIARLGGEIRLTSTPGKGTAFTMRLPVSTAVSNAELFKVGGQVYAVPHVHVVETTVAELVGTPPALAATLDVRSDLLPLLSLHAVLGAPLPPGARSVPAIVLTYAGKRLAVSCDKIVGPREIVVKHLGPMLAPLPLYAGATISGSGKVQLILDPAALVRLAYPGVPAISAGDTPSAAPAEGSGGTPRLAGRVLVADDSRAIREALTRILAREGYVVDVAEDGARAWDMAQQLRYDLLITDLEMPRADGFELIQRLRGDTRLAPIPVVVISSRATAENRRRARELSVRGFVAKPVTRRKVVDALRAI